MMKMREIKFRGKDEFNKWVYGGYYKKKDEKVYIIERMTIFIEVDPKTLGQFSGFFDKDNKEIYEGDIIQWDYVPYIVEYLEDVGE